MKAARFNELSLVDKNWLVLEYGDYLISIEYYDYRVHLYSLNSLFIEMYQNIETRQVERITIASGNDLNKFLSRILIGNFNRKIKG